MPSSISNTSSFHSAYTAPEHDDRQSSTSGSQRNLPSNASLGRLASRLSTAGESFACAVGGERTPAAGSEVGSAFASHGSTQCQYGSYQTQFLLVNLTPSRGRAGYAMMRSHQRAGQPVKAVDVPGVGDQAFEVSAPHTAGKR